MTHYYMKGHTWLCETEKKNGLERAKNAKDEFWSSFLKLNNCDRSTDSFLFYAGNQFHLITYHSCMAYPSHLDFKEEILNTIFKKSEKYSQKVRRAWDVNDDLRESRLRGKAINTMISEINYVYRDNAGRPYCFTRLIDSLDCDDEKLESAYNEAKIFLESNGYSYLISELDELYKENKIGGHISPKEISLNVDMLIAQINKQINIK